MTKLGVMSTAQLMSSLKGSGLYVAFGPFVHRLRSNSDDIADHLRRIYPEHQAVADECAESTLTVRLGRDWRRPWRTTSRLFIDEQPFMYPLTADLSVPMLEWSMNWVVATRAHQFLLCHSAVVEKNGRVVVLPAVSGSGKSTLCAMLVASGWRLFSDEFAVVRLDDMHFVPMPRAVSLKNKSIDLARHMAPDAVITRSFDHILKGKLAFMRAPADAVARSKETSLLGAIIFPSYEADAGISLQEMGKAETFREFILHCMNYGALGDRGFRCLGDLIDGAPAFRLRYGDNGKAIAWFEQLAAGFR